MIDLDILNDKGLTPENLRTWLGGNPNEWAAVPGSPEEAPLKLRQALHNRIRNRIQEGMNRNFTDYRTFYALDKAWSQPFYQITPTLVQGFIDTNPSSDQVTKQLSDWGLTHLLVDEVDPKTNQPVKKLNLPVFFNVFVPLVRAYVTIRWAKIMNDRNVSPLFKYEPFKQTTPLRVICEAITDRVNVVANQYGYYDVMKQAVLKMLHYSFCLMFVKNVWDHEEQWKVATDEDVTIGKTKPDPADPAKTAPVVKGDRIKVTTREGLTYHHPHPTRLYWDMAHPKYTFNHDYGCSFAGYWQIVRYGELLDGNYWNKDRITLGSADIIANHQTFFNTAYSACTLKYAVFTPPPPQTTGAAQTAEIGVGVSPLDRERMIANQYYGNERRDQGVLVSEHFEKLVPKDNGLGDYDCPIWMRFVMAGDGQTFIYAEPVPYNPIIYYGYDADENLAKNPSLSLEILPFQDHFSNVLTQIVLTAKQNLANITLMDEEQIPPETLKKVENLGASTFTGLNLFGMSSKKFARGQNRLPDAVTSFNLPKGNVAELTNVLKTILDVLERVLVMSSHEVAQAASHEQTKEEVKTISGSTTTRLQFTAKNVDIGNSAWKRQLYLALMAFGDDDMWAHLPSDIPLSKDVLEKMGFSYVDKDAVSLINEPYRKVRFKKGSAAIDMWQFASTRDDTDRSNDREVAITMSNLIKDLLSNPITAQAIGPDQAIEWANSIARLAGLPRDQKLRNMNPAASAEEQKAQKMQELQQVVQIVLQQIEPKLQQDMTPLLEKVQQNDAEISRLVKEVGLIMQAAQSPHPAA